MGKFGLAIREWNRMPEIQKTWVRFKQYFQKSHQELQEKSDLTVEDADMHNSNMVNDVVARLQEYLQQEQVQTQTQKAVQAPEDHADNAV